MHWEHKDTFELEKHWKIKEHSMWSGLRSIGTLT